MPLKNINNLCNKFLKSNILKYNCTSALCTKTNQKKAIITCKRKKFDFYVGQKYNKFDEVQLASKGWTHNKSNGDYFIVHGDKNEADGPTIPFEGTGVHSKILEILKEQNIVMATPFQNHAIPIIQSGKHTLIAAETGCGKTLAYLVPLIHNIIGRSAEQMNTPKILIIVPNRELAYQVGGVAASFTQHLDLNVKVIVGGNTKRLMMNPEFASVDILVGTPGAIGKLSAVGIYKLDQVEHTVLDEVDTLLDDSFIDRMESIIKRVSQSQIVLSSATLPKKIPAVLEPIVEQLVQLKSERLHKPLLNVTQRFLKLSKSAKPSQLLLIAKKNKDPIIVFTNRNETCNWLAMFLRENGVKCANINGDMNAHIRVEQWNDFVSGYANILSATDVGSRGLDTTQVKHVLNYDFPLYTADYIHRVGRTGRLGSPETSKITNFISGEREVKLVQNIEMAIRTNSELKYVDGNITNLVQNKIRQKMKGLSVN